MQKCIFALTTQLVRSTSTYDPAAMHMLCLESHTLFVLLQGPRSKSRLLSFFWCPSAACDLVMATQHGLELYQRLPKGQGLRYMGSRKHPTSWCIYSHESRIALLATGEGGHWLQVIANALKPIFSTKVFPHLETCLCETCLRLSACSLSALRQDSSLLNSLMSGIMHCTLQLGRLLFSQCEQVAPLTRAAFPLQKTSLACCTAHVEPCALPAEQAYQVTNDAVLRLPPFQLGPSASRQASPKAGPSQRVSSKDIKVLTMYGRIYCAHIDYRQQRLALYRFYK